MNRAPLDSTSFADRGATITITTAAGRIDAPAAIVEYPSTFCRNCCPTKAAAMSDPNTMMPASAAIQKMRLPATCRSYSGLGARRWRMTNATMPAIAIAARPTASAPALGTAAKLIASTSAAIITTDRMPPRLSTGSDGLVHVARHERDRGDERHHGERQGHQEDRAPPEVLEQRARSQRAECGDRPAERRPQGDRARATRSRPQRRDEGEGGRVGHAGRHSTEQPREEQHLVARRERGEDRCRDRQGDAEHEHRLAPVPVAERAEVEHGRGEPERVPHRDQVEGGLRRAERLADRRQSHVRDREVQVRHRGDQDEREEHQPPAGRGIRCHVGARGSSSAGHRPPVRSVRPSVVSRIGRHIIPAG